MSKKEYIDTLNTAISNKFYVGTISKQPVVEQNQTYMAYFDGVGGTGPELIDQTAYFIKYLIDTEGNVVNPEPVNEITDPQAAPLFNLIDNFEPGKRAVVRLINNDPLITDNPNDDSLTGTHNITHVGRIVPILVTETGINNNDYTRTMSFGPLISPTSPSEPVGNVSARMFLIQSLPGLTLGNDNEQANTWYDFPFNAHNNLGAGAWSRSGDELTAQSSSIEARTRIKINPSLYLSGNNTQNFDGNDIQVQILKNGSPIWTSTWYHITSTTDEYWRPTGSPYIDFNVNDIIKLQYRVSTIKTIYYTYEGYYNGENYPIFHILGLDSSVGYASDTSLTIIQETPAGSTTSELIDGINTIYAFPPTSPSASYCSIIDFPSQGYSDVVFFSSSRFIYDNGLTQNLPSASATMNFSPITIPFGNTGPGDFIRFEYNKNQVYTIYDVIKDYEILGVPAPNTLALRVVPNIGSTQGVNTNIQRTGHFVIYRVINDGTYVVLDVPKPVAGNGFSGIIQPEFISPELKNNYDKIILDLTQKEIIN